MLFRTGQMKAKYPSLLRHDNPFSGVEGKTLGKLSSGQGKMHMGMQNTKKKLHKQKIAKKKFKKKLLKEKNTMNKQNGENIQKQREM